MIYRLITSFIFSMWILSLSVFVYNMVFLHITTEQYEIVEVKGQVYIGSSNAIVDFDKMKTIASVKIKNHIFNATIDDSVPNVGIIKVDNSLFNTFISSHSAFLIFLFSSFAMLIIGIVNDGGNTLLSAICYFAPVASFLIMISILNIIEKENPNVFGIASIAHQESLYLKRNDLTKLDIL